MTHIKEDHRDDIRRIRTKVLGFTQERMAKEIGTSLRNYARFEAKGPTEMAIILATRLADAAHTKTLATPP